MFENYKTFKTTFAGRELMVETGKVCGLANGSCWVHYGETVVMVNVTASPKPREGVDFFPLAVDYEEKLYSDIPCRVSVNSSPNGTQTDTTDNVSQSIKLFCSPKYKIPNGSKIVADGEVFKSSGIPSVFVSHQEIELVSEVSRA